MNPADLPSRVCTGKKLLASKWWEGPTWLKNSDNEWPNNSILCDEEEIAVEKRKTIVSSMLHNQTSENDWYYRYFSKYHQLLRFIGWIYRFKNNLQKSKQHNRGNLTLQEKISAKLQLLILVQKESFSSEKKKTYLLCVRLKMILV